MNESLSNYSVVAIYHSHGEQRSYFASKSLIKNKIYLSEDAAKRDFDNCLFQIEVDGNKLEFKVAIEYDQPIYLRHKISQKYLSVAVDEEEQEGEMRYKLVLSSERKHFKINPCYQYQTKISTKIKFNEEIYLSTEYTQSRQGLIMTDKKSDVHQLLLGFSRGSKFLFHFYSVYEREEKFYKAGRIIWLSHIESDNFLSVQTNGGREEAIFEAVHYDKQIQSLAALWTIESHDATKSEHLKYDETISFKNLYSGQYLSFSKNYKLVDNERIYQIFLEDNPEGYGKFMFKSIKENEARQIQKNSYLSMLHYESSLFLGCRGEHQSRQTSKVLTFAYMEDEDLFRINQFTSEEEQALRFIFAIRREFKEIGSIIRRSPQEITGAQVQEIQQTYTNIKKQFETLKKFQKLFEFVRNQLGSSINFIVENLPFFRSFTQQEVSQSTPRSTSSSITSRLRLLSGRIGKLSYQILCILCEGHSGNQIISYSCITKYLVDVGSDLGAEEALMSTFRNNKDLLPRVGRSLGKDGNIVRMLLLQFKRKRKERDQQYWKGLAKVMRVIKVLLYINGNTLDMNQYVVSEELFKNGMYELIFLPILVQGERITIFQAEKDQFTPIEQIRRPQVVETLESILEMFSDLSSNHSYSSKHYIHTYFSVRNHACLSVMIAYLNKPIRKQLYNKLINFLAKTYLDSSPRLKRQKPLAFVLFHFEEEKPVQETDVYYSSNMKDMMMLKAQESNVCKQLHYSNLLLLKDSAEPSMSEEQLVTFRLNLTEKLLSSSECSIEQLETVSLLMKLECYTTNEMLQIYEELKNKLISGLSSKLVPKVLQIIEQLFMLTQELQLKKMRIYLQHKFLQGKDLPEDEYKFILPLSTRIFIPFQKNSKSNETTVLMTASKEVQDYNELRDTLALMHASPEFKLSLMSHFCNYNQKQLNQVEASNYLESVFKLILQSNLPKESFLKLLAKSTIQTNEEVGDFDQLFDTTKRIQYLILISESWMLEDGSAENQRLFLKHLNQIINYMVQSGESAKRSGEVNIKKQLMIGSLSVHLLVLQLLEKNYYLLENTESRKDMKRKSKEVFETCFSFLFYLIKQCPENKKLIYEHFSIVLMYQKKVELGQIKVYHEFYRGQKDFVKEINFSFIENVIFKIIKKGGEAFRPELCEYNPEYISLLIVLIESLDIEGKFLVQRLYTLITKKDNLAPLLFMDDNAKRNNINQFCLLMRKIKIEPLQVPIIYHMELFRLFNLILTSSSESIRNAFKIKLTQIFKVKYLITILTEPDLFSNNGIQPKLMFILKKEVMILLQKLLEKNEFYAEIYESDELMALLQFYSRIFKVSMGDRKELSSEGESLYIPYIVKYQDYLDECFYDKAAYYNRQVKPFLKKLVKIFEKQPRAGDNSLRAYLMSLYEKLEQQMKVEIEKKTTSFTANYGLKDMKLKWRNFVDDDEDNSKEEKYVKKNILDILKSDKAEAVIKQELTAFYELIRKNSRLFVNSMIKLLSILFNMRNIEDGRTKESKATQKTLKYLSGYILYVTDPQQAKLLTTLLEENRFVQIFIELTTRKQFQLSKMHLKNIFFYCLKILNFLLQRDGDFKFQKVLLKIFEQKQQSQKFLEFLKVGAMEIISSIDSNHYYEQINSALEEMSLCVDQVPLQLYEQAYRMLTYLCRYEPFTEYLRTQQRPNDIDFLDKIYNVVTFLFNDQRQLNRSIKVSSVRATEYILDFVSSMFTGGNKVNQNYLVDSKFAVFVNSVLKIESLELVTAQRNIREQLLDGIIQFYRGNGIEISDLLHEKINLIDFKHLYLLNRFKYVLVKTMLECIIANPNLIAKFKLEIPVEVIKLNLIWIYQFYKTNKYQYEEAYILRSRQDWKELVENEGKIKPLYLRLGFYYYQLILIYEGTEANADEGEMEDKIINDEKEKERVVKKFFKTIYDKERKEEREKSLDSEKLSEEMKLYYHTYYNARMFFQKHTGTLQINLKGELLTVYYPILPIALRINDEMHEEFTHGVNRLSRDEKIKSLLEYENEFYEDLKGQDDYFSEVESRMPMLGSILRMMKHENQFNLIALIFSFIMCLCFLVENFRIPSFEFSAEFFFYITPVVGNPITLLMLLFSLLSFSMGTISFLYLFSRKIPLLKKLLSIKYVRLSPEQKEGVMQSETAYIIKNILEKTIYNFYMVFFQIMSIVHPFFAAFSLVELINRIAMGRFIIKSIKETWFQLFATCGLLIVFNIVFVQIIYDFFTSATTYGVICESQFTCMLLVTDQTLKAGQGFLGSIQHNYINNVLNAQIICEILYLIFGIKVLTEIFSGTIIDKFSELREKDESIAEDEAKICLICGQERFDLDLEYEGFDLHIEKNHNHFNYIKFLFYMRRCSLSEYGIIQRYVHECKIKDSEEWIPDDNSVAKQTKQREEQQDEKEDFKKKHHAYWQGKFRDMKKVSSRLEALINELRDGYKKRDNNKMSQ